MTLTLRLIIIAGALVIISTVLRYIRKRKILMADATGWVCTAVLLVVVALVPRLVTSLSARLGFQSPANFVFFMVAGLLTIKTFRDSARMSIMRNKIEELAHELALTSAGVSDGGEQEPSDHRTDE